MGIYNLPLKNMRRNRIRNISTILRISGGVIFLLLLVSSGLGINSILGQAGSFNGDKLANNKSLNNATVMSSVINYFNSTLGINLEGSPITKSLKDLILGIIYLLDGLASIALLIGVLSVFTTMYFNEIERRREVGLLKTLGFTERQILLSLALEGALLGLIASFIGVILVYIGLFLLTRIITFISLDIILPLWLILAVILITTSLSFILGLYPAWLASKNDLSVVFRNE